MLLQANSFTAARANKIEFFKEKKISDIRTEQAEAEVVPSSSLVEVKVEVGVEVEVEVEVGVDFEVEVGVLRCNLDLSLVVVPTYTGGWLGGWLEDWRVMLNSTQDQIKLKLKFELSLAKI